MNDNTKILGLFSVNDVVYSSLTKLIFLGLVAWALKHFYGSKLCKCFWWGYGVAALVLLWLMTTRTNPVEGDKVAPYGLNDLGGLGGGLHAPIPGGWFQKYINGE